MTIDELLDNAKSVAIFGHVRPDGDCVGSTLGLYNYIKDNYPQTEVSIFLERYPESYKLLCGTGDILPEYDGREVDLAFLLDAPSFERCGANGVECLTKAKATCNIDHHISNSLNLCSLNIVEPEASSASEVLYCHLDKTKVSKNVADCLYLGIIHDTGVFKFSSTSKRTMSVVGDLIEKGCDFTRIVNETYYTRSYKETRIAGFAMEKSRLALNGKVVFSYVTQEDMDRYDVKPYEMSTVVDTLREVSGTEVTVFLYAVDGAYKVSLRSNYYVDVNVIAQAFGGGGHVRAAGGNTDDPRAAIARILDMVQDQLVKQGLL